MKTKVAVVGASGRMGRLVSRLVTESDDFELVAQLGSSSDLGEMLVADVVVDVTVPAISATVVDFAVTNGLSVLVGTSGWSSERIQKATRSVETHNAAVTAGGSGRAVALVIVPNFSVGSVLATSFAAMAARFFDSIEIIESHHASKVDSPSGTAVRTAELIGRARARRGPVIAPHADQRARGQQVSSVPIHSLRMQGVVAKQDVIFGGTGELVTISHETIDQSAYEAGILLSLRALAGISGVVVGLDALIGLDSSLDGSAQADLGAQA